MINRGNLLGVEILIVDDHNNNLKVLYDFFIDYGVEVLIAEDGESALRILKNSIPDLILLDILMPDMDGYELCKKIKKMPKIKNVPVIFMSALSETVDKVKAFEAGGVDYITKPFQYDELKERVKTHLSIQKENYKYELLNQSLPVGVLTTNRSMEIIEVNEQVKRWFPWVDFSKKPKCYEIFGQGDKNKLCDNCPVEKSLEDGKQHVLEREVVTPQGVKHFKTISSPVKDKYGSIVGATELVDDITESKNMRKALIEGEKKYKRLVHNIPAVVYQFRWKSREEFSFKYISSRVEDLIGVKSEEVLENPLILMNMLSTESLKLYYDHQAEAHEKFQPINELQLKIINKDGNVVWLEMHSVPEKQSDGSTLWDGFCLDITERKKLEEEIEYKESLQKLLVVFSSDFMNSTVENLDETIDDMLKKCGLFLDVDRTFLFQFSDDLEYMWNTHEWCREGIMPVKDDVQKYPTKDVPWIHEILKNNEMLFVPDVDELPDEFEADKKELQRQQIKSVLCMPIIKNYKLLGYFGFDAVRAKRELNEDIERMLQILGGVLGDALARNENEKQIIKAKEEAERMATHDFLTNLPNRVLLEDRVVNSILMAKRKQMKIAISILDMDGFKKINDTYGHLVGDEVLKNVASRVKRALRECDTVSRIGGDEFVILITNFTDRNELSKVVTRLIDLNSEPLKINDIILNPTFSIGVALYPEDGDDFEELVKNADEALYKAKRIGKNCFAYYNEANL